MRSARTTESGRVERRARPGIVEGGDDGLLDLRSRETFGAVGEGVRIEPRGILAAPSEVEAEDLRSRLTGWEIHEEDLVHPALAHHLGRQLLDRVGGGHEKDAGRALLHPGEQGRDEALGDAAVGLRGS